MAVKISGEINHLTYEFSSLAQNARKAPSRIIFHQVPEGHFTYPNLGFYSAVRNRLNKKSSYILGRNIYLSPAWFLKLKLALG